MNAGLQPQTNRASKACSPAAPPGLLQRKCACGGAMGLAGECAECHSKRVTVHRRGAGQAEPATVSHLVSDVLRSPGRPLDRATRAFMEPRFGHDFSRVRVHTDAKAAQSAQAVGALAYTVGSHVAFGDGQYAPDTAAGRRTLAHELAHTVQQANVGNVTFAPFLEIGDAEGAPEREATAVADRVLNGSPVQPLHAAGPAVQRLREPYITRVTVNLTAPQSASLEWRGTPPSEPGSDSFTVSTGKGYSNPEDRRGTCTRSCCGGADVQCAPPNDQADAVGSCCTPVGNNFYTGRTRPEHNGWLYWTPVEPIHTSGGRGIALHQHTEVTGQAIGHGCIRMAEENARRIALYSRGRATGVTITGRATVHCPAERQCGTTGAQGAVEGPGGTTTAELTQPDTENPGGGGAAQPLPLVDEESVPV